ncbi:MAG TPA: DUF5906 domain-containing protein [Steroidobacteraceae bacterium]|nr:DUF5906 domain-containing protein [Steroidobacteraceae bacterium]
MSLRPPDLDEAQGFLDTLAPQGAFTFQTFDDTPEKRRHMAHVLHGGLNAHGLRLQRLNSEGAGVFVTVNETDLKGRGAENVTRVRALFVDLDGSPIEPVRAGPLAPHIVVESSPGRWHAYWLVRDCALEDFRALQRGLLARFSGDKAVIDLPRVMRLPGFWHRKGEPFRTRVSDLCEREPYALAEILEAFGWATPADAEPKRATSAPAPMRPRETSGDDDLLDDLHDALQGLPSDDFDLWIRLGQALKPLGAAGEQMWMAWSAKSAKFDRADAEYRWKTFKGERAGPQAVFTAAKEVGWNPAAAPSVRRKVARKQQRIERQRTREAPPAGFEAPPPEGTLAERPAHADAAAAAEETRPRDEAQDAPAPSVEFDQAPDALLERYELIYGTKKVWDTQLNIAMPFEAFSALIGREAAKGWLNHPRRRHRLMPDAGRGLDKGLADDSTATKVEWMLTRYSLIYGEEAVFDRELRRELTLGALRAFCGLKAVRDWGDYPKRDVVQIDQVVFDPRRPLDDLSVCNLWGGWPITADAGSADDQELVQRWLRVLYYAIGESDPVFEWVLKWIAYPLQNPGTKMRTSIIMHGPEGSGKNTIWDAVRRIYGRYGRAITQTQLEQQWNDWMSSILFVVGNEVLHRQEQVQQKGRLKTMITEDDVRIERKFMSGRDEKNYANLVFLSNEERPLNIDPEDRRFLVVWTPPAHPEGRPFYAGLGVDQMPDSTVQALYRYFLDLPLEDFGPHTKPPMTTAKRELIDASMSSERRFVRDWLAGELPVACRPCRTTDLYKAYLFWCREFGERFPRPENQFAARAKKEMRHGIKRYLDGASVKQGTFYLPGDGTPPPSKSESSWLGEHQDFFRKELEQWRNDQ